LKSIVFSFSTTVRGTRDSLGEADQTFSVRLRIIGSVSDNGTSHLGCKDWHIFSRADSVESDIMMVENSH